MWSALARLGKLGLAAIGIGGTAVTADYVQSGGDPDKSVMRDVGAFGVSVVGQAQEIGAKDAGEKGFYATLENIGQVFQNFVAYLFGPEAAKGFKEFVDTMRGFQDRGAAEPISDSFNEATTKTASVFENSFAHGLGYGAQEAVASVADLFGYGNTIRENGISAPDLKNSYSWANIGNYAGQGITWTGTAALATASPVILGSVFAASAGSEAIVQGIKNNFIASEEQPATPHRIVASGPKAAM